MVVLRVLAFAAAVFVVGGTLLSAIRTFVVPRGAPIVITRLVFVASRRLFLLFSRRLSTYEERDHVMASYAPLTLILLPLVWLTMIAGAYTLAYWALGQDSWRHAFIESGSSLFTLGFERPPDLPSTVLSFSEAVGGLGLLALLLAYLPTMYTAFSRREAQVAMLEVRAGSPPTPDELFRRAWAIGWMDRLPRLWEEWQLWFIDIEETHTSLAALSFFRSPQANRSWVTAAGCVLDTAAIRASVLDLPREPEAELLVRSGFIALRRIADYFSVAYDPDPAPTDPITIGREEFDVVVDRLGANGLPVKADRDQAWRDFSGWRVNYDTVLLALAALTMAPYAPWSSDHSPPYRRPPIKGLLRRGAAIRPPLPARPGPDRDRRP